MWLFDLPAHEYYTFFAVLVRFATLFAILPIIGDQNIPMQLKVLMSLIVSAAIYPILVKTGQINPTDAFVWSSTAAGIVQVVAAEALFGVFMGFIARMIFMAIQVGGDVAGTFMGFAAAAQFDPQAESQTGVISKFQSVLAMLVFLVMDGHHIMLGAVVQSYKIVKLGAVNFGERFGAEFISLSSEIIRTGFQIAAPMAVSFFAINVVYGIMAKAIPQLNVLVLSFSVSALVGLFVLFASVPEFVSISQSIFEQMGEKMGIMMVSVSGR